MDGPGTCFSPKEYGKGDEASLSRSSHLANKLLTSGFERLNEASSYLGQARLTWQRSEGGLQAIKKLELNSVNNSLSLEADVSPFQALMRLLQP